MVPADPFAPAPGRTIVPLDGGWTAVILRPLVGHALAFVGLFRGGADAPEVILGPRSTRRFLHALGRIPPQPTTTGRSQ